MITESQERMRLVARTLAEVAQALAAADRADDRVRAALRLLKNVVPYDRCALLEAMPMNGRADFFAVADPPIEDVKSLRARVTALLQLLRDEEEPASKPLDPRASPHLAIPVVGLNQVIGVLFVERAGEPFDEDGLRFLTVIAAQLGSYLTTLRLREEELAHARQLGIALQRLEETDRKKDEFLAMLGHELRNPLGAINFALRIIDERNAEDNHRYHQVIDRQIKHLSRIVDDLLDASRVRLGKIVLETQLVNLNTVAERWLEAFGSTGAVQAHDLQLKISSEPVIVEGDPVRLEQVFSNVLINALKYTPAGGRIEVTIAREAGQGVITVRDTGIGMTPAVLANVFELFTQADESLSRSQGGLGLGLPLVRSIVEKHGGSVHAASEGLGKGSVFTIHIPLAHTEPERSTTVRTAADDAGAEQAALRILIIEDNDDAREGLQELLGAWGHEVEAAADGLQGVALAIANRYDVLIVDIGLPKLDGYEVARRLRRDLRDRVPVLLAMTGYGQPEDRRRATDAGFDAHMVKPVNAFELQARLARVPRLSAAESQQERARGSRPDPSRS